MAFEELEKRVAQPLSYSDNYHRGKVPYIQSESTTHDNSIPNDAADLMTKSLSSQKTAPYRYKALPPIHQQQPQQQQPKQRRNGTRTSSNKSEQLIENQRRIAQFIKHIK